MNCMYSLLYMYLLKYCIFPPKDNKGKWFKHVCTELYLIIGNAEQDQPLLVFIGNTSGDLSSIFYGYFNNGTGRYWLQLEPPRLLNILRIEHNNTIKDVMTLCEILVYDKGL